MSNNFYYKIYSKKSTEELKQIILNSNSAADTRIVAIEILESRNEMNEEFENIRSGLVVKREETKFNEIADNRYNTGLNRFVAMFIDGFVISLIGYSYQLFTKVQSNTLLEAIKVFSVIMPYVYSIVFHGVYGQTIGKMIMNVKIFDKNEKDFINWKQAFLRDIVPLSCIVLLNIITLFNQNLSLGALIVISLFFSYLMLSWTALEIITMLFNKKRRALHDFIAGTVVLNVTK